MNAHNSAGSLIADRRIGTKVGLGFACMLVIFAAVSGTAYLSFGTVNDGFAAYVHRVTVDAIVTDIEAAFLNLRRFIREYSLTGVEANFEAANKEQATLLPLLQQALASIRDPERHRQIEDIVRTFETYRKDFDQVAAQTREQKKLVEGTLDPLGASLQQQFDALVAAAAKSDNGDVQAFGEGRKHLMLVRLNVNKFLGRHEQAMGDAADKPYSDLTATLQALDAATKAAEFRKTFDDLQTGVASYRASYRRAFELVRGVDGMINGTMRDKGSALQTSINTMQASGLRTRSG